MFNVGFATLQVIPSMKGAGRAIESGTAPGINRAGRVGGQRFGSVFATASIKPLRAFGAAALGLFAGQKLLGFFKSTIEASSDLGETIAKAGEIFGQQALPELQKFATGADKALGQSRQSALDAAATFAIFGKSAGLTGQRLVGFSKKMVTLSSDLASFHNTSPEDAITAIGAAMRGEQEPIRRYGILLDEATLRHRALALGIVKTTKKALTPQQRVLAAQAEILAQSKDAQGDFARTSGGLANQQRILTAQWTNAKVQLGRGLLPIVTKFVSFLNQNLFPVIGKAVDFFEGGGFGGGPGGGAIGQTLDAIMDFARPLIPIVKDLAGQFVDVLMPGLQSIGKTLTTTFLPAFRDILPILQPIAAFILRTLGGALIGALRGALLVVNGVLRAIAGLFQIFAGLVRGDWSKLWEGVKNLLGGVLTAIKGLIIVAWNVGILKAFRLGASLLRNIWGKLWSGIRSLASKAASGLVRLFVGAVRGYVNIWINGAKAIVQAVRGGVTGLISLVRGIPGRITGALKKIPDLLVNTGRDLISGFIRGIRSMAGSVIDTIKSTITDALPGFVKKALGIASPSRVFMALGRNVAAGMALGITQGAGRVTKAVSAMTAAPGTGSSPSTSGAPGGGSGPITVPIYLDGRLIAETVFEIGGRDYGYGRKG